MCERKTSVRVCVCVVCVYVCVCVHLCVCVDAHIATYVHILRVYVLMCTCIQFMHIYVVV